MNVVLKYGSRGTKVVTWQKALLAAGYDLGPAGADGVFGFITETATKQLQRRLGVMVDGIVGPKTRAAVASATQDQTAADPLGYVPPDEDGIDVEGEQLILDYEVGGGEAYYNKYLLHPTWPEGESGITIGIGYDLRFNTVVDLLQDWKALPASTLQSLSPHVGRLGSSAKARSLSHITIPWETAWGVFKKVTLPRFWRLTVNTFPGVEYLHPKARAALLSLVFNRGQSTTGSRRLQMANIQKILSKVKSPEDATPAVYQALAKEVRDMVPLWMGLSIYNGMKARRNKEAEYILAYA